MSSQSKEADIIARLEQERNYAEEKASLYQEQIHCLKLELAAQKDANQSENDGKVLGVEGEQQEKFAEITEKLEQANLKYRRVTSDYRDLKERLAASQKLNDDYRQQMQKLSSSSEEASEKLELREAEIIAEKEKLDAQLADLIDQVDMQQQRLVSQNRQLEIVGSENDHLTARLAANVEQLALLKQEQEYQVALITADLESQQARQQHQNEELLALVDKLEMELSVISDSNASHKNNRTAGVGARDLVGTVKYACEQLVESKNLVEQNITALHCELDAAEHRLVVSGESLQLANKKYKDTNKRYSDLKQKFDTANLRYRKVTAELREINERNEEYAHVLQDGQLGWVEPALRLIRRLPWSSKSLASKCTRLAKQVFEDNPLATLFLASLAVKLDPRPYRIKWYGFALAKAGMERHAKEVLDSLEGDMAFSDSEDRVYLTLKQRYSNIDEVSVDALSLDNSQGARVEVPKLILPNERGQKLRIACVMDEFTYYSFAPEAELIQLSPENWQEELANASADFLFIESAWRGKDEKWGHKVSHNAQELRDIVAWCQQRDIPTAFWNKEDPAHYTTFLTTAAQFDHIFTTDLDCVVKYKHALGHDRVYFMPFACQPAMHNPFEKYDRKDAFCFAGAYYAKYPERTADLESFVDELPNIRPLDIYDRNYGNSDPLYAFPEKYKDYIVGTLAANEVDKAYKGYKYAINLNSIKNSQSMFARRVFELLASNTFTLSNYSKGIEVLFGDLVLCSDNGKRLREELECLINDPGVIQKRQLLALRKVLAEHTYAHRIASISAKLSGQSLRPHNPMVTVIANVSSDSQVAKLLEAFDRQVGVRARLLLVSEGGKISDLSARQDVSFLEVDQVSLLSFADIAQDSSYVTLFHSSDYYGAHYLQDMVLAAECVQAAAVGKGAHYHYKNDEIHLIDNQLAYRPANEFPMRSSLIAVQEVERALLVDYLDGGLSVVSCEQKGFFTDPFNYCKDGLKTDSASFAEVQEVVDDLNINTGYALADLENFATSVPAPKDAKQEENGDYIFSGEALRQCFPEPKGEFVSYGANASGWTVKSTLASDKHEYIYQRELHNLSDLGFEKQLPLHFQIEPGLNIRWVTLFLDKNKERISHEIVPANQNHAISIPQGTEWLKFGIRVYGAGEADIQSFRFAAIAPEPITLLNHADHLVLTNNYPSYSDLYRNGFLHRRVLAYREQGLALDVFRLRSDLATTFHEFEGVTCITGPAEQLDALLSQGDYHSILVHFLDENMWQVLKKYIDSNKIRVWVHGAEIHPYHRREFNYETDNARAAAIEKSEHRTLFWRELLRQPHENLKLIFVSRHFSEEVMEDLGFRLPEENYEIIHNPIDTQLFSYHKKTAEHRYKLLSIRTFASKKYGNDLNVKAILELSTQPWFDQLEIRIVGDGPLFDETNEPIAHFQNVVLEKRFLTQPEIARMQMDYGIFLCPTRWDSQGVSRDEAMAAGLVPVTNAVSAVPEFVDHDNCILAGSEDYRGMAAGIARLIESPELFLEMSRAAPKRVAQDRLLEDIIQQEIIEIRGETIEYDVS